MPAPENLAARQAFADGRFGIFLHWGLYAMLGQGEWTMTNLDLNYREYEKLAGGFYPAKFDARAWVTAFREAGARYICFTTRHHDGFSMFHTGQSPYNIVDATPFARDVVKELAEECHRQGLRIHFYYSLIDWWREDAPRGRTGLGTGRPADKEDADAYFDFMKAQLTELLTQYGEVGAIWFDGVWDQDRNPSFDWRLDELYSLIHRLQPACLIVNNHHLTPFEGRGRAGLRARSARREHRRTFGAGHQPAPARDMPDDERHVGLQDHRPELQVGGDARTVSCRGGRTRRQPAAQHRPAARRRASRPQPRSGSRESESGSARTERRSTAPRRAPLHRVTGA